MADSPGTSTLASGTTPANHPPLSKAAEWRRVLLLAFVGLPIVTLLAVCAYGFVIWFMQILFWGPPN